MLCTRCCAITVVSLRHGVVPSLLCHCVMVLCHHFCVTMFCDPGKLKRNLRESSSTNKQNSYCLYCRNSLKDGFPFPAVRKERDLQWSSDREFGRQTLAGQNPCAIVRLFSGDDFLTNTLFLSESGAFYCCPSF